jgi:hypothetical protein
MLFGRSLRPFPLKQGVPRTKLQRLPDARSRKITRYINAADQAWLAIAATQDIRARDRAAKLSLGLPESQITN